MTPRPLSLCSYSDGDDDDDGDDGDDDKTNMAHGNSLAKCHLGLCPWLLLGELLSGAEAIAYGSWLSGHQVVKRNYRGHWSSGHHLIIKFSRGIIAVIGQVVIIVIIK